MFVNTELLHSMVWLYKNDMNTSFCRRNVATISVEKSLRSMKTIAFIIVWLVGGAAAAGTARKLSINKQQPSRVAFIFGGAARSFIEPMVSESLRSNLVFSFCPPFV